MCRKPARGFASVMVIALVVMLGLFGVALAVISTTEQGGATLDLQGVRAYHAARGGVEWGLYQVLRTGGTGCTGVGGVNGASFTYAGNLNGFRVTMACTQNSHEEVSTNMTIYSIIATACNDTACPTGTNPPPAYYVERQLRVTVGSN